MTFFRSNDLFLKFFFGQMTFRWNKLPVKQRSANWLFGQMTFGQFRTFLSRLISFCWRDIYNPEQFRLRKCRCFYSRLCRWLHHQVLISSNVVQVMSIVKFHYWVQSMSYRESPIFIASDHVVQAMSCVKLLIFESRLCRALESMQLLLRPKWYRVLLYITQKKLLYISQKIYKKKINSRKKTMFAQPK
jgi:hypothetical protein